MKSTKKDFTLEPGEYLVTPAHPAAKYYEVRLNGELLTDVMGIIRISIDSLKKKN